MREERNDYEWSNSGGCQIETENSVLKAFRVYKKSTGWQK
jgi:hypothetical protein